MSRVLPGENRYPFRVAGFFQRRGCGIISGLIIGKSYVMVGQFGFGPLFGQVLADYLRWPGTAGRSS